MNFLMHQEGCKAEPGHEGVEPGAMTAWVGGQYFRRRLAVTAGSVTNLDFH